MATENADEIEQLVAPELDATSIDDDSEDEQNVGTSQPNRSLLGPVSLAMVLVMGLMYAAAVFWPSADEAPQGASAHTPRLLESHYLIYASVRHAKAFHAKFGITAEDLQMTDGQLHEQMEQAAEEHLRQLTERAEHEDPEAARFLRDLTLTPEQWEKTHALLDAVRDDRVRALGRDVMKDDPEKVSEHMASRSEELRKLKDELMPAGVQPKGQMPWHVFMGPEGELNAKAKLGNWHAAMTLDTKGSELEDLASARRLGALAPGYLLAMMGTIITGILSIVMTVFTAILRSTNPVLGRTLWIIHSGLAGATCATDLGLTLGVKSMQSVFQWVPCMIMACFSGLEAIWTFAAL